MDLNRIAALSTSSAILSDEERRAAKYSLESFRQSHLVNQDGVWLWGYEIQRALKKDVNEKSSPSAEPTVRLSLNFLANLQKNEEAIVEPSGKLGVNGIILLPNGKRAIFSKDGAFTCGCRMEDGGLAVRGWFGDTVSSEHGAGLDALFAEETMERSEEGATIQSCAGLDNTFADAVESDDAETEGRHRDVEQSFDELMRSWGDDAGNKREDIDCFSEDQEVLS